jgi:hypothetical protein
VLVVHLEARGFRRGFTVEAQARLAALAGTAMPLLLATEQYARLALAALAAALQPLHRPRLAALAAMAPDLLQPLTVALEGQREVSPAVPVMAQ